MRIGRRTLIGPHLTQVEWEEFAQLIAAKLGEREEESDYKETFRVFSKDDEGESSGFSKDDECEPSGFRKDDEGEPSGISKDD